ncbi:ABC transporter permease [Paralimibaculum aggregatum]|uniref:ABC transporter permease n=1 Tax=Paralimibaculum aggregatum TaxID=3036245 RepID=A0ABQ6LF53_9RHOB|nr:ABC transporter permease [Limibaculum sp. NKW23]GMG81961.1 ABC transporter permease [Limibaculum sp. NKW23]
MHIIAFLLRRSVQAALVMLVISIIGFSIQDNLGDPLRELVGQSVSEAERDQLREKLGLNDPFWVQYGRFLSNAIEGDLGTSYFFKRPALDVIFDKFPATFELVLVSALIIVVLSVPAGIYCAVHPGSFFSRVIMSGSIIGISVPVFLTAIFLIWIFAVELGVMPAYGRGEVVDLGWWDTGLLTVDGVLHIILPAISLASIMLPLFIRLIRAEMMEQLGQDYVRFARAKGLSEKRVRNHAFRNTLLPVVTVGGLQIGTLIAYTILTETVFQWPGMGFLFLEAVNRVDTPLIIAYIIVVGGIFVLVNTAVDLIYTMINPMVKLPGESA